VDRPFKFALTTRFTSWRVILSALMKISTTINAIRGVDELQRRLLELLFEVVPAQHAAILLTNNESIDNDSIFALDRVKEKTRP
jgi:hypothetical protein